MVICTRSEQEIGRKPGTGREKWPFVPERGQESIWGKKQEFMRSRRGAINITTI